MEMIKPKITYEENTEKGNYAKFVIEPLERGYGTTLGNSLRRFLLSALPGAAPVGIQIAGVDHEFSTIKGIREDVTEIILNIKGLAVRINDSKDKIDRKELTLYKNTAGPVHASDINVPSDVEILNQDLYICSLEEGAVLDMKIFVDKGRGYVPASQNKDSKCPIGYIPVDSIYTPVLKANYFVENTRVEQSIDFDKLTLEVLTNGTVSAVEITSRAAKIMNDHLRQLVLLSGDPDTDTTFGVGDDDKQQKLLGKYIEEMEFSIRSYNCLKRAGILNVGDLIKLSEDDMLKIKNLGKKSLDEIKEKLAELGLSLRNKDE